jgi:hypothetical protein
MGWKLVKDASTMSTHGREELHRDLNNQVFESLATPWFEIVRSQHVDDTHRWLYLLKKR